MEIIEKSNGLIEIRDGNRTRIMSKKALENIERNSPPIWRTYFDHNFGVVIDSPQRLKEIEKKNGGQFYSVNEFLGFNKIKEQQCKDINLNRAKKSFENMYSDLRQGRSFHRELKEKGLL
jgi:hypothetical protein